MILLCLAIRQLPLLFLFLSLPAAPDRGIRLDCFLKGRYSMLTRIIFSLLATTTFISNCYALSPIFIEEPTSNGQLVSDQLKSMTVLTYPELKMLEAYNQLSLTEQNSVLSDMCGQQYTTLFTITEIVNRQFFRHLFDPLRPLIANPCACQDEVYPMCACEGIEVWSSVSVNRGFLTGNDNAKGFKLSGYDLTVGAQKRMTPTWLLGAAFYYSMQHVNYNVGGSSKCQDALGAIYTLYRPCSYYILGDLTFGQSEDKLSRNIQMGKEFGCLPSSKPKIAQVSCYSEIGKDFCWDCFLFQPFVGFEGSYYHRPALRESRGAPLNLKIDSKSLGNAFSRAGLHITAVEYSCDITLAFDIAWQYRWTQPSTELGVRFKDFGEHFTITGIPTERNSIDMCMNASTGLMDGWMVYVQAAGQKWRRVSNYNFTLGIKASW
jgi:uncharacterized protein with beta-barrel porin domain